jgi:hypothetical protein
LDLPREEGRKRTERGFRGFGGSGVHKFGVLFGKWNINSKVEIRDDDEWHYDDSKFVRNIPRCGRGTV